MFSFIFLKTFRTEALYFNIVDDVNVVSYSFRVDVVRSLPNTLFFLAVLTEISFVVEENVNYNF